MPDGERLPACGQSSHRGELAHRGPQLAQSATAEQQASSQCERCPLTGTSPTANCLLVRGRSVHCSQAVPPSLYASIESVAPTASTNLIGYVVTLHGFRPPKLAWISLNLFELPFRPAELLFTNPQISIVVPGWPVSPPEHDGGTMLTANIWGNDALRPRRVRRTAGGADHRASSATARHDRGTGSALGYPGGHTSHPDRSILPVLQIPARAVGCWGFNRVAPVGAR